MKLAVTATFSVISACLITAACALAETEKSDLAQDLTNPLADLITLPIQANYDDGFGPSGDGWKLQTNIQPVIPFDLNNDWNLITRTIIPVIQQEDLFLGSGSQSGLGDINMSLFLVPKSVTNEFVWGVGPAMLFPTATDTLLGSEKWSAGPSAIMLRMQGPWTYGFLTNHLWSFAGESNRSDINNTFIQPFVAFTTEEALTVSIQSETNYDWNADQLVIPVNASISKLVTMGKLPVSLQAGVGYWTKSSTNGPDGLRFRLQANFVLPK